MNLTSSLLFFSPEDLLKLALALLVGGIIGFERELHSKAAGLRTITLITLGAALFTVLSGKFANSDTSRIASNIVTGVGFLGAGAILFTQGRVKGLTTASSIWAAAALGMAIGVGQYVLGAAATLLAVIVLDLFARLDRLLDKTGRETHLYEIAYVDRPKKDKKIEAVFKDHRMLIRTHRPMRVEGLRRDVWELDGSPGSHHAMAEKLLEDREIKELITR